MNWISSKEALSTWCGEARRKLTAYFGSADCETHTWGTEKIGVEKTSAFDKDGCGGDVMDASTAEKRVTAILDGLDFNKQVQARKTKNFYDFQSLRLRQLNEEMHLPFWKHSRGSRAELLYSKEWSICVRFLIMHVGLVELIVGHLSILKLCS